VALDLAPDHLRVLVELALGGIEREPDHQVRVVARLVMPTLALDHDLLARDPDVDRDPDGAAVGLLVGRLDGHPAGDDVVAEALETGDAFAHLGLDRIRSRHVVEADLERDLHVQTSWRGSLHATSIALETPRIAGAAPATSRGPDRLAMDQRFTTVVGSTGGGRQQTVIGGPGHHTAWAELCGVSDRCRPPPGC
jgi:hypothetical protein